MKKLTEKDAIWCKTQKQWDSIIERFSLEENIKNYDFNRRRVILVKKGIWDNLVRAEENDYTIHQAKDILKKSKKGGRKFYAKELQLLLSDEDLTYEKLRNASEGLLPNICDYLNKVGVFGTSLKNKDFEPLKFDFPTKELEELPEKWCVKLIREESLIDWINQNQQQFVFEVSEILEDPIRNLYFHSKADGNYAFKNIHVRIKDKSFTEITFDQFKKWVLKEEEKPLSIREVQVKVSNQEEANECAEIAKACGEEIANFAFCLDVLEINCYFRKDEEDNDFGVFSNSKNYKEISIQEFRESFGKKQETEIDWSKAGQLVQGKLTTAITTGKHSDNNFEGFVIQVKDDSVNNHICNTLIKQMFKLCTEPITLENE